MKLLEYLSKYCEVLQLPSPDKGLVLLVPIKALITVLGDRNGLNVTLSELVG